jgi:hypothetical protein
LNRSWLLALVPLLAIVGAAAWFMTPREHMRTVAFDNRYGATTLTVHVRIDGGPEMTSSATCDPQTCLFQAPMTNAHHELALSVTQNGQRSESTMVSVDTSGM